MALLLGKLAPGQTESIKEARLSAPHAAATGENQSASRADAQLHGCTTLAPFTNLPLDEISLEELMKKNREKNFRECTTLGQNVRASMPTSH